MRATHNTNGTFTVSVCVCAYSDWHNGSQKDALHFGSLCVCRCYKSLFSWLNVMRCGWELWRNHVSRTLPMVTNTPHQRQRKACNNNGVTCVGICLSVNVMLRYMHLTGKCAKMCEKKTEINQKFLEMESNGVRFHIYTSWLIV